MTNLIAEILEIYDEVGTDADEFKLQEESGWSDEGKYSYYDCVVEYKERFFKITQSRSGSYFTDYHYDDPEITEVTRREERVVITRVHWDAV